MGSLAAGLYNRYDPGGAPEIFTLDPSNPVRHAGEEPPFPPPPPLGLLGLLALGLGYWGMRQSSTPTTSTPIGAATTPPAEGSSKEGLASQRRLTGLTDIVNGGPGLAAQGNSATINRAAQLTGLPNGGLTLGRRTPFPPVVAGTDFTDLPAVLRGAKIGRSADVPWQAPSNKGAVGWQDFSPPRSLFDALEIPDFLRRAPENKDNSGAQPEKYPLGATGSGGGVGGGDSGGGGNGGNEDDCNEEIRQARKICVDAYANGWKGDYSGWKSDYRVGPYKKKSGGPWTIQDCMKGFLRKECGGEDPNDPENQKKYARPPRPRGSRGRPG